MKKLSEQELIKFLEVVNKRHLNLNEVIKQHFITTEKYPTKNKKKISAL